MKAGPGADVDVAEEIRRVVPFVAAVRARHPERRDQRRHLARPRSAGSPSREGADLLNDTWAGRRPALGEVAAEFGAGIVCSHTGGAVPRTRPHRVRYADVVADVIAEVTGAGRAAASRAGCPGRAS